jgi:hypothetical protein
MKTLLEKAKQLQTISNTKNDITEEQLELACGWAKDEISLRQIQKVMEYKNVTTVYTFLANCFKYSILKTPKK